MNRKPISPKVHAVIDYGLVAILLLGPRILGFSKKIKKIYTVEALLLVGYIAITDHPAAVKPLIPFETHGKIDPFNVAQFAIQNFLKPFRNDSKAWIFNIAFTLVAGLVVALTDWKGKK